MYFCYQNSIIMSQAAYTIRLDSDLKNRFDTLCEGFGMSRLVRENCDCLLKIPMKGKITSLNASVSSGIIIYEVVRQRIK